MIDSFQEFGINLKDKRSIRFFDAGLLKEIDESFVKEVRDYWQKYYKKSIDPSIHIAFMNLTGKKDPRMIPGREMWREIIPYFNDQGMDVGYRDKNIYDILIKTPNSVESVIKRVRGNYYDSENNPLNRKSVHDILMNTDSEYIIKPSDSNNGVGIEKLIVQNKNLVLSNKQVTLEGLEDMYESNFVVQKVIHQHPIMARPHPSSVNTLRMVTLRWKGEIKYLLTFARFGANGSVKDNAGAGGVCLGLNEDGDFFDIAVDEHCNTYSHHPTSNFKFSDMERIPNFGRFKEFVVNLHKSILHHDFISWDIAVSNDAQPIFIEANFAGATWLYQMASQQPLFGDLTEEILVHISQEFQKGVKRDIQIRSLKAREKKLKRNNRKLKKENQSLKDKLTSSDNEIKNMKEKYENMEEKYENTEKKYENMINSRSWKITAPLRKISNTLK